MQLYSKLKAFFNDIQYKNLTYLWLETCLKPIYSINLTLPTFSPKT